MRENILILNPLVPDSTWDYFCLDRLKYHNRWITVIWDKTGMRYNMGVGLLVCTRIVQSSYLNSSHLIFELYSVFAFYFI